MRRAYGEHGIAAADRFQTKEQQVADFLRESILSGLFPRGQKLKQAAIAERLQISITPVREALKILEAEGFILVTAHRGAVVAPVQLAGIDELFQLRMIMEPKLTYAATRRIGDEDIEELAAISGMIRHAVEPPGAARSERNHDFRFHFRLYRHADLPQTLQFARVVWAKYPFDLLGTLPNRAAQMVAEHDNVLAALRARDARRATRAMHSHLAAEHTLFRSFTSGAG